MPFSFFKSNFFTNSESDVDLERGPEEEAGYCHGIYAAWAECASMLGETDADKIRAWADEVDGFLNFSALFSAVITVFLSQTYVKLLPDNSDLTVSLLTTISQQLAGNTVAVALPPFERKPEDVLMNSILFSSLLCSLMASGMGLWVKEWLREFSLDTPHRPRELARVRQFRHHGLTRWRIRHIIATISFFLQLSVALFMSAILGLVWTLDPTLRAVLAALVGLWSLATALTAVLPSFSAHCPYKSPFARWLFRVSSYVRRLMRSRKSWRDSGRWKFKSFESFEKRERKTVEKQGKSLDIEALTYVNNEFRGDPRLEQANECFKDVDKKEGLRCIEGLLARRFGRRRKALLDIDWKEQMVGKTLRKDKEMLHLMRIWCEMTEHEDAKTNTDLFSLRPMFLDALDQVARENIQAGAERIVEYPKHDSATVTVHPVVEGETR